MAAVHKAEAIWEGDLLSGRGRLSTQSGAVEAAYSFRMRTGEERGATPEELIGAAHAGCFSMALAAALTKAGHKPARITTAAEVTLDKVGDGYKITTIRLRTSANVPGIDQGAFREHALGAKKNCPVSQALTGVEVELDSTLE